MSKSAAPRPELSGIRYFPAQSGRRAVFMAEARSKKEIRQIRELFDTVGQLAEVVPISHGAVMSYAVQSHGEASLFGKIEWLLKTQFTFSMVERNFSDVTFQLVRSLCEHADAEIAPLPECGVCSAVDPFPARATLEYSDRSCTDVAYCARCAGRFTEADPASTIHALLRKDRRRLRVDPRAPVSVVSGPDLAPSDSGDILFAKAS